jgi:type IV pilus assembly protein PilY1
VAVNNTNPPPPPRFFGVWAYGKAVTKTFSNLAEAVTFDGSRFTDTAVTYAGNCTGAANSCNLVNTTSTTVAYNPAAPGAYTVTGPQANTDSPGWYYQYQGTNEKTGAGSTVVLGCTAWSGFVATGVTGATSCVGDSGTLTSRAYLSHFVTGAPTPSCGYADGVSAIARYSEQKTTAPPTTSTVRVVINASGQVEYSALQINPGAGPSNKTVGTRTQVMEPVYWLEVPRDLHNCRHDPLQSASTCK